MAAAASSQRKRLEGESWRESWVRVGKVTSLTVIDRLGLDPLGESSRGQEAWKDACEGSEQGSDLRRIAISNGYKSGRSGDEKLGRAPENFKQGLGKNGVRDD